MQTTVYTQTMAWIPGGRFLMGSERFYPEERPVRRVAVAGLWMDRQPVTVREFRRFVRATGYVTVAERAPDPAVYPDADPALLVAGSLVFHATAVPVSLGNVRNWWTYVRGAVWSRPEGPRSDTYRRGRHLVVHVAYKDAEAYAAGAGKSLPTQAEWEHAARGGLEQATLAWWERLRTLRHDVGVDDRLPDGRRDERAGLLRPSLRAGRHLSHIGFRCVLRP